ncbi:ATP-binding protein [Halopenitus sp. H-Gu1]|uniref:ATP-binding protein n=1 Tax=Halopenitus sp. H-Gu1 TaxID=3242697 RepID=UPI00359DEDA9
MIDSRVAAVRESTPEVIIDTELPDRLELETDPRIEEALEELLENAVEHNDTDRPMVRIAMRSAVDGSVLIDIADDGPGIPEIEREVLEEGFEAPLFHSQGLGLWIARTLVVRLGGTVRIVDNDNDPRGSVVRLMLPPGSDESQA